MALNALVFDVDGTLVDSNAAHLRAWMIALKECGYQVSADRIAVEVGKGGDKLVPSILGKEADQRDGDSLRKGHTAHYKQIAESEGLRLFPGTTGLLAGIRQRGLKLALATSSSVSELRTTERAVGISLTSLFDVVATGDDSHESKPAPGILNIAIQKLKMSPAECVMVGDTPYDTRTARDAGVVCLGVTCGGMNDEPVLRRSGMRAVYRDPAELAARLDEACAIASPGKAILTAKIMQSLMREALNVAREGMSRGEVPIGCVIARGDGQVVARGHNELNISQDRTAHAEMVTFRKAAGNFSPDAKDLILVSTLEPCVMCLGAAMEAAVDTIIYGMHAPHDGGRKRVEPPTSPESQMPRIIGEILSDESRKLFKEFLKQDANNPRQVEFVRQLLSEPPPVVDSDD